MSMNTALNNARRGAEPETPAAAIGVLFASLVVTPLLFVVLWNYGATELLERLGAPDANIGVVAGVLTVYFLRALLSTARGG